MRHFPFTICHLPFNICGLVGIPALGSSARDRGPVHPRGGCVSPFVHWQPALRRFRGRVARAPVERRRTHPNRAPDRSGDGTTARLRVRRLRGPRRGRGSHPPVPPAAIQRPTPCRQRGATSRRTSGGTAARRFQWPTPGWRARRPASGRSWSRRPASRWSASRRSARWWSPRWRSSQRRLSELTKKDASASFFFSARVHFVVTSR